MPAGRAGKHTSLEGWCGLGEILYCPLKETEDGK
jgi:hypothetical protein